MNLCELEETEDVEDDLDTEITKTVEKRVFTLEKKPLRFIFPQRCKICDTSAVKLSHTIMAEIQVHFWCGSLTPGGDIAKVYYTRVGYVPSIL